ncbi:MAG: CAP domain-containing protein [Oscillospiraceae bacterium]|nr:CAP domain-containing protein [Oscillospiraceae bacterium]
MKNIIKTRKIISAFLAFAIVISLIAPAAAFPPERLTHNYTVKCALLVLGSIIGNEQLTAQQELLFDINGDGRIAIDDALEILRLLIGLENLITKQREAAALDTQTTAPPASTPPPTAVTELTTTAPPTTAPPPPATEPPPANAELQLALEVIRLMNIERENEGLPPLLPGSDAHFAASARRAEEIVVHWAHDRPDGAKWSTVFAEFDVNYRRAGENLAMGQSSPSQAVRDWMNSPGHRANIMHDSFTHVGVGVVRAEGRLYWVQLFISL